MDALVPGSKSGVGLYIVNDRIGAQGQLGGYLNYSYKVKISKKSDVSFGLAGGASQYSLDGDKIILSDNDDSSIPQQNISAWAPDAKFGVFFSKDEGYVGLSVSGLLGNKISYNFGNTTTEINLSRHYYLTGGYIFDLNNNVKCYPSFLLKEDFKSPTGYDINTFMQFNGKFWLGFSYRGGFQLFKSNLVSNLRKSNVIAFIFELEVNKSVRIGYAFDYSTSALNDYNHGSHEIGLSYIFPGKKFQKMLSPRYF
jgi:type IX secretion system PorP/SprF family membrane protein